MADIFFLVPSVLFQNSKRVINLVQVIPHLMRLSVVMVRPRPRPGFDGKIPMRGVTVREPSLLAIGRPQNRKTFTKELSFCFGESGVPDRQIWHRAKNDNSTRFNFNVAKSCN